MHYSAYLCSAISKGVAHGHWTPGIALERVIGFPCKVIPCTGTHQTVLEVRQMMQLQNKIEEWDAIDLLSCSMWKIIFTLQTNSYCIFWNNWIPWGGEAKIIIMFLNITFIITLKYNFQTSWEIIWDFPCVSPTFSFGSRNLRDAEVACILGLSWLYFWGQVVLQGSMLISSKPVISFGLLKHIS